MKEAVGVPVVGNGDVRCGADAAALVARTGCDAVMIARGAEEMCIRDRSITIS